MNHETKSDTPETDALYKNDHRPNLIEHARKLERERDEWRRKAADLHARHKGALEDIEKEIQSRNEWRSIAKEALASFRCTQRPETYPDGHWSRRAQYLLENAQAMAPAGEKNLTNQNQ
jgi:phage shock protein A